MFLNLHDYDSARPVAPGRSKSHSIAVRSTCDDNFACAQGFAYLQNPDFASVTKFRAVLTRICDIKIRFGGVSRATTVGNAGHDHFNDIRTGTDKTMSNTDETLDHHDRSRGISHFGGTPSLLDQCFVGIYKTPNYHFLIIHSKVLKKNHQHEKERVPTAK